MKGISELSTSLKEHLNWNKSHIDCFVRMLLGLIAVRTVNLQEIALAFASEAKVSSRYRRIQRFFAYLEIDLSKIAVWLFKLFFPQNKPFYLIIDRTNWYWGKQKINVFMLAIAYEGIAIPLFWQLLDKAGSSSFDEQKALINQFLITFSKHGIAGLLADREFMNGKLLQWLNKRKIPYYIRIKENTVIRIRKKKWLSTKKLFKDLKPKAHTFYAMTVQLLKTKVYLAASRSERGELMIVVTNQNPKTAIAIYLRRWEIENLFQSLKGRGFAFEETHLVDRERISKLLVLLAIGFAWAHKVGEWRAHLKPIMIKHFNSCQRPQYSYFRYGLDYIRTLLLQFIPSTRLLNECFRLICFSTQGGTLL